MKITRITPIMADGVHRIITFVKIETDQPSLIGWGEASLETKPRAVAGCIEDMAPMIIGQDPLRIEHCWQILYRAGFWRLGVIGLSALSGIDQALWDIKGKELGRPVYELLGGRVRDTVRMYTHVGGDTAEALARDAQEKVAHGWTAVKTVPVPITRPVDGPWAVRYAVERVRALREAVGPDVDVLLDFHGRLSPQMAIRIGVALDEYNCLFFEEPVQAENPAAMAPVARALTTPIATGERLFTRWGFRELLEHGAASLLQPDPCHAGGISEVRKIATMGEVYYAGLAPHNPYGPLATAVCVHLALACPNFVIQEMIDPQYAPEATSLVHDPLPVVDGHIAPPTRPGLGVEVDEAACARRPPDFAHFDQLGKRYYGAFHPDGAVADS
ncbi:MAG TPA: galactonate dehydratase [Roseiflexaceae bacterium]|nr:galactonate dehydratase [Roseiflexaceae bacterium]HMP40161.1 galactonate dehydratase [Roseiflexaceae bacterium]